MASAHSANDGAPQVPRYLAMGAASHDLNDAHPGKRRRLSPDTNEASASTPTSKRSRISIPIAALPDSLLQRVLQHELSLSDLASVARVNRHLNYLLSTAGPQPRDDTNAQPAATLLPRKRSARKSGPFTSEAARSYLQEAIASRVQAQDSPLHSDEIWRAARGRITSPAFPNLPAPSSERQLWSLLSQRTCQFCHTKPLQPHQDSPESSVAHIIWSFELVSCGPCLLERCEPSAKALQNPQSAIHVNTLPHIWIAPMAPLEVTAIAPQKAGPLKKHTFKKHLEQARAKGPPNKVDMDTRRKATEDLMLLASQWESWDRLHPDRPLAKSPANLEIRNPRPRQHVGTAFNSVVKDVERAESSERIDKTPPPQVATAHSPLASHKLAGPPDRLAQGTRRKDEIVRRCAALNPPISLEVLELTEAFNASLLVRRDLVDSDWAFLKPRLEQQRQAAEKRLQSLRDQRANQFNGSQNSAGSSTTGTAAMSKEQIRQQFEALQKPTHDRLVQLFNDYVSIQAGYGRNINNQPMTNFVLRGLAYVHRRFTQGSGSTAGQKLKLQELKWLLTNKIQDLYPSAGFKIFSCPVCSNANGKDLSLDELIQHHASNGHPLSSFANASHRIVLNSTPWDGAIFLVPPEPADQAAAPQYASPATPGPSPGSGWIQYPPHANSYYGQGPPPMGPSPQFQNSWSMPPPSPHYPGAGTPGAPSPFSLPFGGPHPGYPPPPHTAQSWASAPHTPIQQHSSPFTTTPQQLSRPPFQQHQQDVLARFAADTWQELYPVRTIPMSVRCQVVIQRAVALFKQQFRNEPNIDVFFQTVMTHPLLDQFKHASGIACKACTEQEHKAPMLQTFSGLILHFKDEHIQRASALKQASTHSRPDELQRLDWTTDMIWLAEKSEVLNTQTDFSMTGEIWLMIQAACPQYQLGHFTPSLQAGTPGPPPPPPPQGHVPPPLAPQMPPHMHPPYHRGQGQGQGPGHGHGHGYNPGQPVWVPPGAASPPPGAHWNGPASSPPPPTGAQGGAYSNGYGHGFNRPSSYQGHSSPYPASPMPPQYSSEQPQYARQESQQLGRYDVNQLAYQPASSNNFRQGSGPTQGSDWGQHYQAPGPASNRPQTATTDPSPQPDIAAILAELNRVKSEEE